MCTVYSDNFECLHGDELSEKLHRICNSLLNNSSRYVGYIGTTTINNYCRLAITTAPHITESHAQNVTEVLFLNKLIG